MDKYCLFAIECGKQVYQNKKRSTFMKRFLQLTTTVLLIVAMVLSMCTTLIGCDNSTDDPTPSGPSDGGGGGGGDTPPATKVTYSISVKTIGGLGLADITYGIYEGENLKAYGKTDKNGYATVDLVPSDNYSVELSTSSLAGYNAEGKYPFVERTANIVLSSSVIEDTDLTGVTYELGDVMRDFTVTTIDGDTFTLSEVLKTKKAVLINFWYSTCSPCINEFPYMDSAYQKYQDDIAVIALNNYAGDNAEAVKIFQATMGLTIPMVKDYSQLGTAFNVNYYPTSILVDRYGTICLIETGGLTSEKPFIAAFEHFSATDYQQKLFTSFDELTPAELPNEEMPSSDAIGAVLNGEGFDAIYTPETESANSEYAWPFLIGEEGDERFVYTSNSYKDNSYAAMHATVNLRAGQALAVDWFADTELGADILFILVDGKDIYQLSGVSEDWETVYPYVATEDGKYFVVPIPLQCGWEGDGVRLLSYPLYRVTDGKHNVLCKRLLHGDTQTPHTRGRLVGVLLPHIKIGARLVVVYPEQATVVVPTVEMIIFIGGGRQIKLVHSQVVDLLQELFFFIGEIGAVQLFHSAPVLSKSRKNLRFSYFITNFPFCKGRVENIQNHRINLKKYAKNKKRKITLFENANVIAVKNNFKKTNEKTE